MRLGSRLFRRALLAALALTACAPALYQKDTRATSPPPLERARYPLPAVLPARYLRTLERDPGGYDPSSPPGGPSRGGASDLLLGDLLFHAPSTLGPRAQKLGLSCQTCHPHGASNAAFTLPGVADRAGLVDPSTDFFRKGSGDGIANPLSIPSLRGARFTAPYGHDGRTASLSEFIQSVVTTEFDGRALDARRLAALVRYVQDLDFLPNSKLGAHDRLIPQASPEARRGEALFAKPFDGFQGASCATCHAPTTFFRDGRTHRVGSATRASEHAEDDGEETPTLLGTAETAPYFHDGRFAKLAEVIAWFDLSYGLGLSVAERADLTAYVEAVGSIDKASDDRPLARRLNQSFAYLALAADEELQVRRAALEEVLVTLAGEPKAVAARASELRAELEALRARVEEGPVAEPELRPLRASLARLAADWAGALPAE